MTAKRKPSSSPAKARLLAATKVERKEVRQKLGPLRHLRIQATTERRYVLAYGRVCQFLTLQCLLPIVDLMALDSATSRYVECCWEEGDPKNYASDALAGLQYFLPCCKGNLPLSWGLVAAWQRHELPGRALPFTPEVLAAVCGALLIMGFPRFAAGCVMGFNVMLRTSELESLTAADVAVSSSEAKAVIRLRDTKAGGRAGVFETAVVDDQITVACIRYLVKDRLPGDRLVGISDAKMRSVFHRFARLLEMESLGVKPYSLRRGGATWKFRECGSHETVAQIGRWSNIRTCRRYIEDGAAQLAAMRFSPWQASQIQALGAVWRRWMSRELSS